MVYPEGLETMGMTYSGGERHEQEGVAERRCYELISASPVIHHCGLLGWVEGSRGVENERVEHRQNRGEGMLAFVFVPCHSTLV